MLPALPNAVAAPLIVGVPEPPATITPPLPPLIEAPPELPATVGVPAPPLSTRLPLPPNTSGLPAVFTVTEPAAAATVSLAVPVMMTSVAKLEPLPMSRLFDEDALASNVSAPAPA